MKTHVLRWSLAVVLGGSAAALGLKTHHAPLIALAVMEVVGAILLLPRRTRKVGATLLLASLAFACAFHALSGEWPPLAFLVYAPAIVLVATPC